MVEQITQQLFRQFCKEAKKQGYVLQSAEEGEMQEVRRQTEARGLDSTIYQTFVTYVAGRNNQKFNATYFRNKEEVTETKEHLFEIICKTMKSTSANNNVYAFLHDYRELVATSGIYQQLEAASIFAITNPDPRSRNIMVWGRDKEGNNDKSYILPDGEDKLPQRYFNLKAERLIVGFKYEEGFPVAGKIILNDRPLYPRGLFGIKPKKVVSVEELIASDRRSFESEKRGNICYDKFVEPDQEEYILRNTVDFFGNVIDLEKRMKTPEEEAISNEVNVQMRTALHSILPLGKERRLIQLLYGIDVQKSHTLKEAAFELEITESTARLIEKRSLRKLRNGISQYVKYNDLFPLF